MCTKIEVKDVVDAALSPLLVDMKYIKEGIAEVRSNVRCTSVDNAVEKLKVQFDMRVAEFQRMGDQREKDLKRAFTKLEKLEDINKKEDDDQKKRLSTIIKVMIPFAIVGAIVLTALKLGWFQ